MALLSFAHSTLSPLPVSSVTPSFFSTMPPSCFAFISFLGYCWGLIAFHLFMPVGYDCRGGGVVYILVCKNCYRLYYTQVCDAPVLPACTFHARSTDKHVGPVCITSHLPTQPVLPERPGLASTAMTQARTQRLLSGSSSSLPDRRDATAARHYDINCIQAIGKHVRRRLAVHTLRPRIGYLSSTGATGRH